MYILSLNYSTNYIVLENAPFRDIQADRLPYRTTNIVGARTDSTYLQVLVHEHITSLCRLAPHIAREAPTAHRGTKLLEARAAQSSWRS